MGALEADRELVLMLEDSVAAFLAERHERRRIADFAQTGCELWPQMAELGLLGLALPEEDGGSALGAGAAAAIARKLGENLVPEPFVANGVLPAAIVAALPAGEARRRLAATIQGGADRVAVAWQERPGQIDPWPVAAASAHGALRGTKIQVASPATTLLVTAQVDGVPAVLLVEGVSAASARAMDGSTVATVVLDGLSATGAPLLTGEAAERAVRAALDLATLTLAAQLAGLVRGALDLTLEHLRTRVQFGKPIGSFQALQHRAVDMHVQHALTEAAVQEACIRFDAEPGSRAASAAVSAAKARAGAAAMAVCKDAVQMHGAIGFTREADVGLYLNAALRWSSWLGDAVSHRRRFVDLHGGYDG